MGSGYSQRRSKSKTENPIFLLVCEGEKTEPQYFKQFQSRDYNFKIKCVTSGRKDPVGILIYAESLIKQMGLSEKKNDVVWCVFDKDRNTKTQICDAMSRCKSNFLTIAVSNPCFEIWYLWHFQDFSVCSTCIDTIEKVKTHIPKYCKNENFNDILSPLTTTALKRARHIEKNYGESYHPADSNPSSQIFRIIDFLQSKKRTC